ncbi:MAG TPA: hypothetical protein VJ183_12270 [Chloroflexia bacterium]|nr:hypothetical protein [Chloroflexia bacterium]
MESRSHIQDSSSIARVASSRQAWPARRGLQVRVSKTLPFYRASSSAEAPDATAPSSSIEPATAIDPSSAEATHPIAQPMRWWEPFAVFLVTFAVLATLVPRMAAHLDPPTGDEPFYLMTAISILQDGDLNECNNYRARDEAKLYPAFFAGTNTAARIYPIPPDGWQGWQRPPYPLAPHPANLYPASRQCISTNANIPLPADGSGSELYSKHGLGMTLLALPGFALFGRIGVMIFLAIMAALLAANVYLLARESTGKRLPAILTWVAFALASPFFAYSFLIFPEMSAGLLVLYAFRRIRLWNNNPWQVAGIGACLAFLPWLHYRFLPLTLALFIYFIYQERSRRTGRTILNYGLVLGQLVVSAGLLMLFFYHRYGQIYPDTSDHAGISDFAGTVRGAVGLMLDEQWGLLIYAPIFIMTFVGLVLMATKRAWLKDLLWTGIIIVPYYLLIANYAQWWGEWGPPARYLVSVLPLLALPFALSLEWIRGVAYKAIYGLLLVPGLVITFAFAYQPQWMYSQPRPFCGSALFQQGMTQLMPWLFGDFNPAVLKCSETLLTEYPEHELLPSFVGPYFMYAQDKTGYWGGKAVAAAWNASLGPIVIFALIIGVSLLLALWQDRKERDLLAEPDASQRDPITPKLPAEEVPRA